MTRVISLGAGVQSSAMLLMALEGRFGDLPDAAVFADTQCEPYYVYEWLDFLTALVTPFPIIRATKGNLAEAYLSGLRCAAIPMFSTNSSGKRIMMNRFCSKTYKVEVIRREVRKLTGKGRKARAEMWIGISTDEAQRGFKPSGLKWLSNRYPLLDRNLSRRDCAKFVFDLTGRIPPKSACYMCPYTGDDRHLDNKLNHPSVFALSAGFDIAARSLGNDQWDQDRFIHRSMIPLAQVSLKHEGQEKMFEVDAFGNECEGMCGL